MSECVDDSSIGFSTDVFCTPAKRELISQPYRQSVTPEDVSAVPLRLSGCNLGHSWEVNRSVE